MKLFIVTLAIKFLVIILIRFFEYQSDEIIYLPVTKPDSDKYCLFVYSFVCLSVSLLVYSVVAKTCVYSNKANSE